MIRHNYTSFKFDEILTNFEVLRETFKITLFEHWSNVFWQIMLKFLLHLKIIINKFYMY